MKVGTLCQMDVITVDVEDSLSEAAGVMQFHEVGSLIAFEGNRMVGIITERDLVRAVADGVRTQVIQVRSYMSESPVVVESTTEADEAARLMLELGIRHLPVVDGGELVGVLSGRDLLAEENMVITSATDLARAPRPEAEASSR